MLTARYLRGRACCQKRKPSTMPLHLSPMLNFYFHWKPYQGANPITADKIFVGEDANFDPNIEAQPIWPKLAEYLRDGVKFWDDHWVHHPFLLPEYNGQGTAYHRWFDKVFCRQEGVDRVMHHPKVVRDGISFVELLPWPTTGAKNIHNDEMMDAARNDGHFQALAGLIFKPTTKPGRTVFITKMVAEKLNEQLALIAWPHQLPVAELNLPNGPWHQVFEATKDHCRVVIHYHPMAHFPAGGNQQLRAAIRTILLG